MFKYIPTSCIAGEYSTCESTNRDEIWFIGACFSCIPEFGQALMLLQMEEQRLTLHEALRSAPPAKVTRFELIRFVSYLLEVREYNRQLGMRQRPELLVHFLEPVGKNPYCI